MPLCAKFCAFSIVTETFFAVEEIESWICEVASDWHENNTKVGTSKMIFEKFFINKNYEAIILRKIFSQVFCKIKTPFGDWFRWLRRYESNIRPQGYEPCELPLLYSASNVETLYWKIQNVKKKNGIRSRDRTYDLWLRRPLLFHWAMRTRRYYIFFQEKAKFSRKIFPKLQKIFKKKTPESVLNVRNGGEE